jgi:hypothetical protein
MPYSWSINNVATAEVMHTALAYFEAGRAREGYQLLRANVLDNMYYGQSPANFGQLSHYDAARGECYRDFGDCIGIASRTLLQGLFGIIPNALYGECIIRPGLPAHWPMAQVTTPYLTYKMTRKNGKDRFEVTQKFTRPLRIVFRHNQPDGSVTEIQGTTARTQVFEVPSPQNTEYVLERIITEGSGGDTDYLGLSDPIPSRRMKQVNIDQYMNAEVDDIFKQRYESPRPQTTTLQIPIQGVGEWCHPQYTPVVNDSLFRTLAKDNTFSVADIPFRTPQAGPNIVYTSLWDNYPDAVTIPLKGRASAAYLLMAGSTNHMQSRIDNGQIVVTYTDGTTDTLPLYNPHNWCPIEQDYYEDGLQFHAAQPRPYRLDFASLKVSREHMPMGERYGYQQRDFKAGAAVMLDMPLNSSKLLKNLTLRTLSNDVVIGLMGLTLQR